MPSFYITTPIYYINAEPHLGHAYTSMVADAIARSRRLLNDDVFFLTGTDEHGQKVERAAKKAGLNPREFADGMAAKFRDLLTLLDVSNDDFIRTTEERHLRAAQAIWRRVRDRGYLYKAKYEGWYCTVDELFVPETQLVDGKRCPTCGNPVERLSEESYFFKLSEFTHPLLDHYRAHPEFITPEIRRNEMVAFVSAGLRDLSVSRTSFKWGIPVPDDPSHVMYVWFDALTNYLTAAGYPDDASRFGRYWPANVHLMGKEIVRQHSVYWPAFLMAADLPVPKQVIGHGWWLMNEAKMSKSLGNVVRPDGYVERFGVDALRYFVMREMVLGQDANFTDDVFLVRYNADLANDLGNLVSRAATMIQRYCDGRIPPRSLETSSKDDSDLEQTVKDTIKVVHAQAGGRFDFNVSLRVVWELIGKINRYIVLREPWALAKDPGLRQTLETTLYNTADALRVVAALIDPVMPSTASRIRTMFGMGGQESWVNLTAGTLVSGGTLGRIEPLFPRMEHTVEELRSMSQGEGSTPQAADRLSIDDFMKVELRTAKVLTAEKVPNSRKLVKMSVDVGSEQRTLVAGIAEAYEPEALVGRTVVMVFNLKPAKLMGIESNGMVLAASPDGGKPTLVGFDLEVPPGTRVR